MDISANLTEQQEIITEYIASGWLPKQIAKRLSLSIYTVNNHLRNAYQRSKVNSAIELAAWYHWKVNGNQPKHKPFGVVVSMDTRKRAA